MLCWWIDVSDSNCFTLLFQHITKHFYMYWKKVERCGRQTDFSLFLSFFLNPRFTRPLRCQSEPFSISARVSFFSVLFSPLSPGQPSESCRSSPPGSRGSHRKFGTSGIWPRKYQGGGGKAGKLKIPYVSQSVSLRPAISVIPSECGLWIVKVI